MTTRINIAIDVMGSDKGPETIIEASSISKTRYPEIKYTYFGNSKLISKYVKKYKNLINSYEIIHTDEEVLPEDKPRYLMGVGTPINLLENIALGIDMFDCVMPTRNARNGMLFTSEGTINIKNKKWADDYTPIDPNGTSFVDKYYSKAYLRHLFSVGELLGKQIATLHNIRFYLWLMEEARKHLAEGTFYSWKNEMIKKLDRRL